MQFNKKYKIGMRAIKTGLAVSLSIILSELLNLQNPSLVGIAAIVSMQSSVNESFIAGKNRILGTFVGAFVGLVFSYILPYNFFFLGLGIIVVIYLHNLFKWKQSLSLSAIVYLVVFLYQDGEYSKLAYAINRLLDTSIGVIVSMLVNYFIAQPDDVQSLKYIKEHIYTVLKKIVYDIVTKPTDMGKSGFKEQLVDYNKSFNDLKRELELNSSSRRNSSNLAFDVLDILENIEKSLLTLLELDMSPILDEENKDLFNEIYLEEFSAPDRETGQMDVVYNFHLNKIFNKILEIEELL